MQPASPVDRNRTSSGVRRPLGRRLRRARRQSPSLGWVRSIVAGLAVLAMVLGQLEPALARVARDTPLDWALEICTLHGGGRPIDRDSAPSTPAAPGGHGGHAACCLLHAPEFAPPPSMALEAAAAAALSIWLPRRFLSAARTPRRWPATQPRAPPPQRLH